MKRCREAGAVERFKGIPRITIKDIRLLAGTRKEQEKEQQESDETERNGVK
ncbi:GM25429 [Drosophila sechellia]|uniref:GM25429 n=1 Tax=Drosophila sechellia TaxID=7238 RepID=B4HH80_DROSE|nr:GM25429 [Drosophila sechellia]